MAQAKFIRIDSDEGFPTIKHFNNSTPYESLKLGEVIDVDCEDLQTREYYVSEMSWDFTHFGDTLVIKIRPVIPISKPTTFIDPISGNVIGIIKN